VGDNLVIKQVINERQQGPETRKNIIVELEKELKKTVVVFFTSFVYPVMIEDNDADIIEGVLQKSDNSKGIALIINSPGGLGLSAERIINICRHYSGTKEYWALVPNKAKSAATMICLGASKIIMGKTSELGPIDPQISTFINGERKVFSACNIVESYEKLFNKAVRAKGNLEPYLLQLSNYDEREIIEYRTAIELSEDIAIQALHTGMLKGETKEVIRNKIDVFLKPAKKKAHGRPIYPEEIENSCGLNVEILEPINSIYKLLYELYIRTNDFVSRNNIAKCIETKDHSFAATFKEVNSNV